MQSATSTICLTFVMFSFAGTGQCRDPQDFVALTHATLLSSGDWKLAPYPVGEGEKQNVYSASFDDHNLSSVRVPGEVQVQLGRKGMDRYYQTKELSTANDKEWWYRKQFVVPKENRGKLLRLEFEGVDYFASVWLNGKSGGPGVIREPRDQGLL